MICENEILLEQNYLSEVKKLLEVRIDNHVSQETLAKKAGISQNYLSEIETQKKRAPDILIQKLKVSLNCLILDSPLEVIFDYVRIRFPIQDEKEVIEEVLGLRYDRMLCEERAFYGYEEQFVLGDIVVMSAPNKKKNGVLLELKGKGCRQFESYLVAQRRSWFDFFQTVKEHDGIYKRIDLAVNDKAEFLDISELAEKCKEEECISYFRKFGHYISGDLTLKEDENKRLEMGNTLYIGSMSSSIYFCIYEKDYEQYVKTGAPTENADIKNRFEIRLKEERAQKAVEDFLLHGNVGRTTFGIIQRYMNMTDRSSKLKRDSWKTNERWLWFMGEENWDVKLTIEPEPYSFDKTLKWLASQVMPTLKMAVEIDRINGTSVIADMLENAKLEKKHLQQIELQTMPTENFILD